MQPNDPNQQPAGFPVGQPGQQPGIPQQGFPPQQFEQPQQPAYASPPQSGGFSQPSLPPTQPGQMGQPQSPVYGTAPQQPIPSQYLNPLEPSPQQFQPLPSQPSGSGGGKKVLIMVIALIVVVALGVGGYLFATKSNTKNPTTVTSSNTTNSKTTATPKTPKTTGDFTKLGSFTLVAPTGDALGGMTVAAPTSANVYTVLTNSDGTCTIGFGILSQTALPGTTLNGLIASKIADAKKQDANIKTTGPTALDSLILKDTAGKTYALPTANFTLTDSTTGGGTIAETYSAVELADKSHVVVYSACSGDKANDQTTMAAQVKALQPIAKAIMIQTK